MGKSSHLLLLFEMCNRSDPLVTRAASLGVNFVIRRVNGWHTLFGNWSENLKTQYAYDQQP